MREKSQALFQAALAAASADLQALDDELAALKQRSEQIYSEMLEHKAAIVSLLPLVQLSDEEVARYRELSSPQKVPSSGITKPPAHGTVTRAVVGLLDKSTDGLTAREIIDEITRGDFRVMSPETAVRSGIKNLRGRGLVEFVSSTGRYRLKRS